MVQVEQENVDLARITADIVSSYVANNSVQRADLMHVIVAVHAALQDMAKFALAEPDKPQPPVQLRKSVTADYLISLEDGQRYKSLKRHLGKFGLTPETYRAKWGLPADYPMVAPSYAAKRSELAKNMGLGQQRRKGAAAKRATLPGEGRAAAPASASKAARRSPAKKP